MFKAPKYPQVIDVRAKRIKMRGVFKYSRKVSTRTEHARNAWGHNPLWLLRYIAFRR